MHDLDTLSHQIARFGFDRFETEVQRIADQAFRLGVAPALVGVLSDPGAPTVARERAFARTVAALRRGNIRIWPAA
ncbi:MAG: hypothetical protein R3246_07195 [Acidimicrobiia bacterium]|nr:hypothetical protein [Acidimicrobiia bacterium]